MEKKTGIFVEGLTLHFGLKGKILDFKKFKEWLAYEDEHDVFYFNCLSDKTSFLTYLSKSGYILHVRKPIFYKNIEKYTTYGIDVELATIVMEKINDYDKFIIVSGKADYIPLVEKLVEYNKEVEIVNFKDSINSAFYNYKVTHIEDFFKN